MKRNMRHVQVCCVLLFQTVVCLGALSRHNYILQDEKRCDATKCGAQTDYIPLSEEVMMYGGDFADHPTEDHQHDECNNGVACELQIFPDSGSSEKQELNITFQEFFINVDDVTLNLDQASTTSFKDVQHIATLTKNTKPTVYLTGVGNVLRFRLHDLSIKNETDSSTYHYGFIISIRRTGAPLTTPDPPVDSLSPATTAFIIVISLVVVIIVVFLAIKTILLRRKMESFRRKDDEPLNSIILADGSRGSHPRSSRNEYSHIPTGISRADGPRSNMLRQTSEESSYVMTDFPYVNAPIVVLKSPESSESPEITVPPPAYDEAIRYSE